MSFMGSCYSRKVSISISLCDLSSSSLTRQRVLGQLPVYIANVVPNKIFFISEFFAMIEMMKYMW